MAGEEGAGGRLYTDGGIRYTDGGGGGGGGGRSVSFNLPDSNGYGK